MNIQSTIVKCINEQLFLNNYLVMPNFGGFVLKTITAQYSLNGSIIIPPSKTLSFNAQLKQNDGVLVTCLQNKLNCSGTVALQHLNDFASYCTSILNTSKRITFDNIGFFYTDFENNICFEPQTSTNFLTSSFGLTQITLKTIETEPVITKKQPVFIDKTPEKATQKDVIKKQPKRYSKVVVPSLVALTLFSLLALFVSNSKITGQLKASIMGHSSKITYSPISYSDLKLQAIASENNKYIADANGIASISIENTKTVFVNVNVATENQNLAIATKNVTTSRSNLTNNSETHAYKIVLGCFSLLENAERLKKTLQNKNVDATVSNNKKGLYVVSNGNFATKEDAVEQLAQIKSSYPDAWIKNPD
ncbi:MAG: SPOR domain-containing protein [Bacteroidota bacterium]|nr:SPOR domain-containing protein [Bacteroidota bacterium]